MGANYVAHVSSRVTPQSDPIPGKPMVANSAGGYSFAVDDWTRLDRFLVLGSERGTYYASERKLTVENADCVRRCAVIDFIRAVDRVVEISESGRAPKNDPAIFALALLAADQNPNNSGYALEQLSRVCRTGTHLFQFIEAVKQLRGMGRAVHRALAAWYIGKQPRQVAYQVTKYQQRNGFSHRDILRLVKPAKYKHLDPSTEAIFGHIVGKPKEVADPEARSLMEAVAAAKVAKTDKEIVRLIRENGLVRECIPTEFLGSAEVWGALLDAMPMEAMVRNLGKMTEVGLIKPLSAAAKSVADRLRDAEYVKRSRLHPFKVLLALTTYRAGRGVKGSLTWEPVDTVSAALNDAYYLAFANVQPTDKRFLLGLDISGSMFGNYIAGSHIDAATASAAMAMVTMRTEPKAHAMAFCHEFVPAGLHANMDLESVYSKMRRLSRRMGGTDCALPMLYAKQEKLEVDVFVVYTDSETWAGNIHPVQALCQYRQSSGIPARLIVVGMCANGFTIADPSDGGMLDVVGFDASAPEVMADFCRN